jgi:hypothetical protein
MAVNITKTQKFTNPTSSISFSQIRNEFGGNSTNVRAAAYRRNESDQIDWNGENASEITPRIPDATENADISSDNNWNVSTLRNTVTDYVVTQSGTDLELSYSSTDTGTWNGNLNRNILKKFNVNGTIYVNNINDDALSFDGNLYNLEIDVNETGEILAHGGASGGGNGGDALYVNNTYTKSDVEIRSYGKIYSGGAGGASGNSGNSGGSLNCSSTNNFSTGNPFQSGRNLSEAAPGQSCRASRSGATWVSANQNSVRDRCRGGGARRGNGDYPGGSYQCSPFWTIQCQQTNYFNLPGGSGGSGGTGGPGRGYNTINASLSGNSGNSGGTNSCSGGSSTGNSGNPGTDGGDWGQSVVGGGSAGIAIRKKNARVEYYTDNTLKGPIKDL